MKSSTLILVGVFALLACLELKFSYEKRTLTRKDRWFGNIALIIFSTLILRLLFPLGVYGLAQQLPGPPNHWIPITGIFHILIILLIMDCAIYFQHRFFHQFDWLWRLHKTHHSDPDLDITSALRFHPFELLLSLFYKALLVRLLGAQLSEVILYETLLVAMAIFNHANLYLPKQLERFLRIILVTPQMHLIHHSRETHEVNSNFGNILSIWDRLFHTYLNDFNFSGSNKRIGLNEFSKKEDQSFWSLLMLPFK